MVDDHDRQQHAKSEEEYPIDVMGNRIADLCTECEEQNASYDVEGGTEDDVAKDPTVIQCADDENKLRYDIYDNADGGEYEVGDEEGDGFVVTENGDVLEGCNSDEEADTPDDET